MQIETGRINELSCVRSTTKTTPWGNDKDGISMSEVSALGG